MFGLVLAPSRGGFHSNRLASVTGEIVGTRPHVEIAQIDREFEGTPEAAVPTGLPFLQIAVDSDKNLTLRADPDMLR